MPTVNVQQAKTQLSQLLVRAEQGEEIVIARSGKPVARLLPFEPPRTRSFGTMHFQVPDDFDAPLPEQELAAWE